MAKNKEIITYIKLQVPAGAASPSPPVGPALGQHGVNLMDFCNVICSQDLISFVTKSVTEIEHVVNVGNQNRAVG